MPQDSSNPQPNALHEKQQELLNKLQAQCNPARGNLIEQDDTSHVLAPLIQHFNKEYGKNIDQQLSEQREEMQDTLNKLEKEKQELVDELDRLPAPLDKRLFIKDGFQNSFFHWGVFIVVFVIVATSIPFTLLAMAIAFAVLVGSFYFNSHWINEYNEELSTRSALASNIENTQHLINTIQGQLQKLDKPTPKQQAADILYAEKPQQDILDSLQEPSNIDDIIASLDKIDQSPLKGLITDLMLCKEPSALEKTLMRDALLAATQLEPKQSLLSFSRSKTTNYPQLIADLPGQNAHIIQEQQQELQKEKEKIKKTLVRAKANFTNSQKALESIDKAIKEKETEKCKSEEETNNEIKKLQEQLNAITNSPNPALMRHSDIVKARKTEIEKKIDRLTTKLHEISLPHEKELAKLKEKRVPIAEQTKQAKAAYKQAKADLATIDKKITRGKQAILDSAKDVARCKRAMAFVTRAQKDPALNKKLGKVKVPAGDHSLTAAVQAIQAKNCPDPSKKV